METVLAIAAVFLVPILGFASATYATRIQLRQAEITRASEDRRSENAHTADLTRLKTEAERWVWEQAKAELDKMKSRLDAQDNTISEQGSLITQLRQTIHQQNERINALETERDDWRNRALAAENAKRAL